VVPRDDSGAVPGVSEHADHGADRVVWGALDPFLSPTMARPSIEMCDHGELVMLDEHTHWLHWDAPEKINPLIGDWLAGQRGDDGPRS